MNRLAAPVLILLALAALPRSGLCPADGDGTKPETLDAPGVQKMITGLGYESKVLNAEVDKEKYEFTITRDGLDVPIAYEVSTSRNFIWFTCFLGEMPAASAETAPKFEALLRSNHEIQPTNFYITSSGKLMLGLAVDNRAVSAAVLRRTIDKLAGDVVSTQTIWGE